MSDYSSKTVCFVDNGLFGAFARRVAPAFRKAYYFSPWQSRFPSVKHTRLWSGFDELEVILDPLTHADEVDLWVFLDVFHVDLQWHLVQSGARVWGARSGEELEMERWQFKKLLKRLGLPVGESELIKGTPALRKFLEPKKNWFVKGDSGLSRGDMETWKWKNEHISTNRLHELEYDLGPFGEDFPFVVENEIEDACEIGYDGYTVDGLFPSPSIQGIEIKDCGLLGICKPYDKLTPCVRMANAALSPEFTRHNYRGFMCMEMRKTAASAPFVLDPCCRLGSPSNELLQTMLGNWPEIFWEGAEGNLIAPKQLAKYGMVAMIANGNLWKNWQPLAYPAAVDPWVILINGVRVGQKNYSVPQTSPGNVGGVVGTGNTILEAVASCAEHARQVSGQSIDINLGSIGRALDEIESGAKYGVRFTDDKLPTAAELKKAVS